MAIYDFMWFKPAAFRRGLFYHRFIISTALAALPRLVTKI